MNNPSTCPHFSQCAGCELADPFNPPIWQEALSFFVPYKPEFVTQGFSQTRLKAKLAVRPGPQIGLFKKNSHDVLPIPHCLVHHPAINRAVVLIREEMIRQNLPAYCEKTATGVLRYIQLFVERATGRVQLVLVMNTPHEAFCQSLLKYDLWHSIWLNIHPTASNTIFGPTWRLIHGEPFLWQTINQTPIAFHPAAFSQTHLPLFEKMVQKIETWIEPNDKILELYAGVGAIGLSLHHKALTLVENNPFAHLSFQQSKTDIPYLCIDAKEADLTQHTLIIVDPPRKGLDPVLLKKLCELQSARLIYISCGFESFKRDAKELLSSGWKLKEAAGYLLFPGTNHVEILSHFVSNVKKSTVRLSE